MKTKVEISLLTLNGTISATKRFLEKIKKDSGECSTDFFVEKYKLRKAQALKRIILEARKESEETATNICFRLSDEIFKTW